MLLRFFTAPPDYPLNRELIGFSWTGLAASLFSCIGTLAIGASTDWPEGRIITYSLLMTFYFILTQLHFIWPGAIRLRWRWMWLFLLLSGAVCVAMMAVSRNDTLQTIAFTVPLVWAGLALRPSRMLATMLLYAGLVPLGNLLAGNISPAAFLNPLFGHGLIMVLIFGFTRLYLGQAAAQDEVGRLAADLASQRDYLARLNDVTTRFTRDLNLPAVLEQVALAGHNLAQAAQVRIWLRDEGVAEGPLRLAAAVPPAQAESPQVAGTLLLPLWVKDREIGLIELFPPEQASTSTDALQLQPFANASAVAIANARLYEQARLTATLAERNRLARDLHDTIAQGLAAITMQLESAVKNLERDPPRARARVERAHELARETLQDVRRSVWDLAAPLVGGQALVETLAEQVAQFGQRSGIPASYQHRGPLPTLDTAAATQLVRIVQEALTNVEKHAHASAVEVCSESNPGGLRVQVRDNGVGFDITNNDETGGRNGQGFGLRSLHERARLAGGTLHVETRPGRGTTIIVDCRL
ncbi:MAG: sensor histidine kinase [Chloroflexaceae bacterium]|jgi:signal transduction histidine kinase|nr:sensor histidine kinase [Chloroflexaceae bacterium]